MIKITSILTGLALIAVVAFSTYAQNGERAQKGGGLMPHEAAATAETYPTPKMPDMSKVVIKPVPEIEERIFVVGGEETEGKTIEHGLPRFKVKLPDGLGSLYATGKFGNHGKTIAGGGVAAGLAEILAWTAADDALEPVSGWGEAADIASPDEIGTTNHTEPNRLKTII